MKKTWNGVLLPEMKELSTQECAEITGGQTVWFWLGYFVSGVVN